MMMGPTKKKIMIAAIVSFVIPVVVGGIIFIDYKKDKEKEIEELKVQTEVDSRYVFARNMVVGEIITSDDILLSTVKKNSAPIDSYDEYCSLEDFLGRRMRINAEENTLITSSMLTEEEDANPSIDERLQEFNMIVLPSDLQEGDFVDVRLTMGEGENYIVISGKEVKKVGKSPTSNTIFLQLDEEEIIRMTAAILESYMTTGTKLYATKYVNPSEQLYKYDRVDYVKKFETTLNMIVETRQKFADEDPMGYVETYGLGDPVSIQILSGDESTNDTKLGDSNKTNSSVLTPILGVLGAESVKVEKANISTKEIANLIGLTEKETQDIRNALANNDEEVLGLYREKLITTRKDMINTYPVKVNIAKLIKENPNILDTIKAKYNIEELSEKRVDMLDLPLYRFNDEGELEILEPLRKIDEEIKKEIESQKAERKEYLQSLLLDSSY